MSIQASFASEYQPLEIIHYDTQSHEISNQKTDLKAQASYYTPSQKTTKKTQRLRSMRKKFGPLELKFRINPLRNRQNIRFNLDLRESYRIFTSSKNLTELYSSFSPDQNYNIIDPRIKDKVFKAMLLPMRFLPLDRGLKE